MRIFVSRSLFPAAEFSCSVASDVFFVNCCFTLAPCCVETQCGHVWEQSRAEMKTWTALNTVFCCLLSLSPFSQQTQSRSGMKNLAPHYVLLPCCFLFCPTACSVAENTDKDLNLAILLSFLSLSIQSGDVVVHMWLRAQMKTSFPLYPAVICPVTLPANMA